MTVMKKGLKYHLTWNPSQTMNFTRAAFEKRFKTNTIYQQQVLMKHLKEFFGF
jgi:hypothetical protein